MTVNFVSPPPNRRASSVSAPSRRDSLAAVYRFFQNYYHGHHILNPNPSYICDVKLSLKHWQLKDLIQIDHTTGSLYHTSENTIRIMSLKNPHRSGQPVVRSREAFSLPYSPQCFNHAPGGMVVTGGLSTASEKAHMAALPSLMGDFGSAKASKGLFSVYSPSMQEEMTFRLGDMINNAVTIYSEPSGYKSYVCNNDSHLYVVDMSDHGICGEQRVVCEENTSLNNVVRAPNGNDLAVTGDSGNMYLVDPRASQCIQTLVTGHDSGFGLSYHANGTILAGSFQDGTCLLYDLRSPKEPLREIKSSRPGNQSGAFRCCKFMPASVPDLLVISEDVGRVHVVDYKDLSEDSHQVIVFPHALDSFARYTQESERQSQRQSQGSQDSGIQNQGSWSRNQRSRGVGGSVGHNGGSLEEGNDSSSGSDSSGLEFSGPHVHNIIDIYDDANYFSAPLVYDYDYVTNVNPKLFKDFIFEPEPKLVPEEEDGVRVRMGSLGYASYRARSLAASEECTDHERLVQYQRYYHELYQQSMNHICGEMKISGIDWYDNSLYVGGLDGGVLRCDVNVRGRRSFGSFSYA